MQIYGGHSEARKKAEPLAYSRRRLPSRCCRFARAASRSSPHQAFCQSDAVHKDVASAYNSSAPPNHQQLDAKATRVPSQRSLPCAGGFRLPRVGEGPVDDDADAAVCEQWEHVLFDLAGEPALDLVRPHAKRRIPTPRPGAVRFVRVAACRHNLERAHALLEQTENLGHTRRWGGYWVQPWSSDCACT